MAKNYRSQLVGVFGDPVDENPTGVMEEAAFAALGLDFRYITMFVRAEDLAAAMAGMRAMHFRGINLTIPHKVAVLPHLDELSEAAEIIGAVNTVVNNDGALWGDNTDGKGFMRSLADAGTDVAGKTVTLLGAGGAARAVGVECALAGAAKITVINPNEERGRELASLIAGKTKAQSVFMPWRGSQDIPEGTDILVNATSLGLFPHVDAKPDLAYDSISAAMTVCDVVFNAPNTRFLAEAEVRGAKCVNGLGMLVNQGALNFTLWTGREAPIAVMTKALANEFFTVD